MVLLRIHAAFFSSDDSADNFFVPQPDPSTYSGFQHFVRLMGSLLLEFGGKLSCDKPFSAWRWYWVLQNPRVPRLLVNLSYLCLNLLLFFHTNFTPQNLHQVWKGFGVSSYGNRWSNLKSSDPKGLGWCLCHAQPRHSSAAAEQVG